jgi:septin family protein
MYKAKNIKKSSAKQRKKVTEEIEFKIALLGQWGFSNACIIDALIKHKGVKLCGGTIGKYLRLNGVKLKDYRNGLTPDGKHMLATLMHKKR